MPDIQISENQLREHVHQLAGEIGERNVFHPEALGRAKNYIQNFWERHDLEVLTQSYVVEGVTSHNLWIEVKGEKRPEEIVVIGAHYDSVHGSPGANINKETALMRKSEKNKFRGDGFNYVAKAP